MKKTVVFIFVLSMLFVSESVAEISVECDAILSDGIRNNYSLYSEEEQFKLYQNRLCIAKYSSYESFKEGIHKGGLSIPLAKAIINVSSDAKFTSEKFSTVYSSFCSASYDERKYREVFDLKKSQISKVLADAWLKCHETYVNAYIKTHDLGAYIDVTPADDWRTFDIDVKTDMPMKKNIVIRAIAPDNIECSRQGKKVVEGKTEIDSKRFILKCTKHPTESAHVKIETNAGVTNEVYVPAETSRIVKLDTKINQTNNDINSIRAELTDLRAKIREPRIQFKYYPDSAATDHDPTKINTGFRVDDYIIGIVGFDGGVADIQEHDAGRVLYVKPVNQNGIWWIHAKIRSHKNKPEFSVWVIVVPRDMVAASNF